VVKPEELFCCEFMFEQLMADCDVHGRGHNCPNVLISAHRIGTDKIPTLLMWARNAEYECRYCPSCGKFWGSLGVENVLLYQSEKGAEFAVCQGSGRRTPG